MDQDQINAVTPFGLTPGKNTTVRVTTGTAASSAFAAVVIPSQPAIFATATRAAAVNQDGTINSPSNPAKLGSVVSIWTTGIGAVYQPPPDGQVATGAQDYHCCNVYVFDKPTDDLYAGAAPGMVAGVVQVNFRVPADLSPYLNPAQVSVVPFGSANGSPNYAMIYVTQ